MTTQLCALPEVVGQQLTVDSSNQYHALGSYSETNDGRGFRYALVGATSTVPGKVYQSAAQDTTNQNPSGGLAVGAVAVSGIANFDQVVLSGSLTLAANLLANGFMSTDVTPGQGYTYRVKGNTAVAAATGCVVTLEDPLVVALTASSKVVFTQNPYAGIIVNPATATSCVVGVSGHIISNGNYGWIQTRGICGVLNDGGTAVGLGVAPSASVVGAVKTATATQPNIGYALCTLVTTEYNFVFLTLD